MSQDFSKCLVLDERLCVTDKLEYAVVKGAQNMTPQVYNAISQSPSSITFNLQIPSEMTVIDRKIMWQSTVRLKFQFPSQAVAGANGNAIPAAQYPIQYGLTDALSAFPLHQMTTVQSVTINNNTVSMNTRDVLAALMRFNDKRELMRLNGMTPNMFDTYGNYADGVGAINNSLGSYGNVGDNDLLPRGSFILNSVYSGSPTAKVPVSVGDGTSAITVYAEYTCSEPLLLSPFIFANPETNAQGIYGVQNMNIVFNVGDASRVWRSANPWFSPKVVESPAGTFTTYPGCTLTIDDISNSRLILNQLTPHPSQLMSSRNVVPYYTVPRYITQFNQAVLSDYGVTPAGPNVISVNPQASGTTISSTNIQLNQVPDKVIIFVRKALNTQTPNDSDSFLAIRGISINFNNSSGILSTASPQDLYRYSVETGSNQSWEEFYGHASKPAADPSAGSQIIPTTGSLLCLEFGKHIQLADDYFAPGSLANLQFQFNLNVVNQFGNAVQNWELVLITVNSGLFVCERGTSSSYTGILTRQDVLDVSSQQPHSRLSVKRMIGGGFNDTMASVTGKVGAKMPPAKASSSVLSSLGYGRSGGGASGGGMSGGRRHKLDSKLLE
jgi:hypothetical protein